MKPKVTFRRKLGEGFRARVVPELAAMGFKSSRSVPELKESYPNRGSTAYRRLREGFIEDVFIQWGRYNSPRFRIYFISDEPGKCSYSRGSGPDLTYQFWLFYPRKFKLLRRVLPFLPIPAFLWYGDFSTDVDKVIDEALFAVRQIDLYLRLGQIEKGLYNRYMLAGDQKDRLIAPTEIPPQSRKASFPFSTTR